MTTNDHLSSQTLSAIPFLPRWILRNRQVLQNLSSLVVIQIVVAGVGFLTRVAIANALGVEAFGELAFAIAIGTYCQTFVLFGFEKSLVRDLVHFPNRTGELLKASLLLRLGLFAILVAVGSGIAKSVMADRIDDAWRTLPAILATVIGAFTLGGVYDAWKEMWRHAIYHFIERCLYFALVWLLILTPFVTLSLAHVGLLMLVTVTTGLCLQYRWALPRIDFNRMASGLPTSLFIARSNLWVWFAAMLSLTSEYFNQIILGYYAGSMALGEYSAAWLLTGIPLLLISQVTRIGSEAAARYTRNGTAISEQRRFLGRYITLMTIIGVSVGLPCVIFSKQMLMVFRPEYIAAAGTLRILGFLPILYGPYVAALQYVISSRLDRTYFSIVTIVGVFSLGLSFSLIPSMGSAGAALSAVISVAVALSLFLLAAAISVTSPKNGKRQEVPLVGPTIKKTVAYRIVGSNSHDRSTTPEEMSPCDR